VSVLTPLRRDGRESPNAAPLPAVRLAVERIEQPDDLTCGPTAMLQIYRYHGVERTHEELFRRYRRNPDGGTLAVYLALAALADGFRPTLYTFNLDVFDPSWSDLPPEALVAKLEQRSSEVEGERLSRLKRIIAAYVELIVGGGRVRLVDLDRRLLVELLAAGHPILTGLSATWLYRTPRELAEEDDDVAGWPVGHFVVVTGYDPGRDHFLIADPMRQTPFDASGVYSVASERLMASILLGDATDDAVLLVLESGAGRGR